MFVFIAIALACISIWNFVMGMWFMGTICAVFCLWSAAEAAVDYYYGDR